MKILIRNIDVQLMYNYDHCERSKGLVKENVSKECPSMLTYLKKFDEQDTAASYLASEREVSRGVAQFRSHKADRLVLQIF